MCNNKAAGRPIVAPTASIACANERIRTPSSVKSRNFTESTIPRSLRRRGAADADDADDDDDARKRPAAPRPSDDRPTSKSAPQPVHTRRLLKNRESPERTTRSVSVSSTRLLQIIPIVAGKKPLEDVRPPRERERTNPPRQSSNTGSSTRFLSFTGNLAPNRDRPRCATHRF